MIAQNVGVIKLSQMLRFLLKEICPLYRKSLKNDNLSLTHHDEREIILQIFHEKFFDCYMLPRRQMLCQIYYSVTVETFGKFHLQVVAPNVMTKHFSYKTSQLIVRKFI